MTTFNGISDIKLKHALLHDATRLKFKSKLNINITKFLAAKKSE